ncbi:MAG: hypothetical protein ACLPKI_11475 [Streptosporangiaceae bacterium]
MPAAAEPAPQDRRGYSVGQGTLIAGVGLVALALIAFILVKGRPAATPARPAGALGVARTVTITRRPATVTYVVTGTPGAAVSYGPAGSDFSGQAPLRVTKRFGRSSYYGITAQLQAGGSVQCEILLGNQVIAKSVATGGYNVVFCQARKNPLTGRWHGATGGQG